MQGLYVTVPIASFRRGAAREFWETLPLPPPSTVYGFLLSLVGEEDRHEHLGARVTAGLIDQPERSSVLRRLWRIKDVKLGQGNGSNVRPDYQQLLTGVRLLVWIDSSEERRRIDQPNLESRINAAMDPRRRGEIRRFGGLSIGESTHMVDEVSLIENARLDSDVTAETFVVDDRGSVTLTVWVDHVGSAKTVFARGRFETIGKSGPPATLLPQISDVKC